ncbi:MAG: hypothetical protein KAT77_04045 [Nanoarchaeota archaeon]|nr:hypothetical protein [Nanoarchaeota archaeon]
MSNVLRIEGRKTPILNSNTNLGVILTATYQDKEFEFAQLSGFPPTAMVLQFLRSDKKPAPSELNIILLTTDSKGTYEATGLSQYDKGDGQAEWYNLGDDLEIKVEATAEEAIGNIPNQVNYPSLN